MLAIQELPGLTDGQAGEGTTGSAVAERVYFVSRFERPGRASEVNPHIRAIEFVSVVALILVALAQLTQIFAVP